MRGKRLGRGVEGGKKVCVRQSVLQSGKNVHVIDSFTRGPSIFTVNLLIQRKKSSNRRKRVKNSYPSKIKRFQGHCAPRQGLTEAATEEMLPWIDEGRSEGGGSGVREGRRQ